MIVKTIDVARQGAYGEPTRRDFQSYANDDVTLQLTVYDEDGDELPLDVTGAEVTLTVYGGWRSPDATAAGTVADGPEGRIDIVLPSSADMLGRYRVVVTMELDGARSMLFRGDWDVRNDDWCGISGTDYGWRCC